MQSPIELHPASEAERLHVYRNVHDVWSRGLSMDEHLRRRLQSVQHNRAHWFVGCLDGQVVTSLGCYPLQFQVDGNIVPGFAIGAVHTLAEFRGRGFAPRLIEYVEHHFKNQGCQISMLYSDIKPDYYARLGYQLCPAWEGWMQMPARRAAELDSGFELEQFVAQDHVAPLSKLHAADHSQSVISIHRDQEYFAYLITKDTNDEFYWLRCQSGETAGYVRLASSHQRLQITDFALADRNDETMSSFASSLIGLARARRAETLGGWLPNHPVLRHFFDIQARKVEITMLKSINPQLILEEAHRAAAQNFSEIEHV